MATQNQDFPVGVRVVLCGLAKAPQYNGKRGIVKSELLTTGRHNVHIEEDDKIMSLKPDNLKLEPRDVDSLSVKELKLILQKKRQESSDGTDEPTEAITGMEKSELQKRVAELSTPEENANILAKEAAKVAKPLPAATRTTTPSMTKSEMERQAEMLSTMSPDQLRQQAAMMRSMDPATIRRMNPQLAGMSDQQIRFAADQMDMMANNPAMMKMAAEQVKQMSPEELERQRQTVMNDSTITGTSSAQTTTPQAATPAPTPAASHFPKQMTKGEMKQQADMMSQMSPEQMRQQAAMMRSMDPATLRRMNPQMSGMTDEQIRMAADQFEMIANNPSMMKMAVEQINSMSPEELEQQRQSMMGGGGPSVTGASASFATTASTSSSSTPASVPPPSMMGGGADPMQMLQSMSPEQLRQQAQLLKTLSPDQLRQMNPQFRGMTDSQLQMAAMQMEMMAANPDMMKTAAETMKNMSPEDIKAVQEGRMPSSAGLNGFDPSKLDPKQVKSMMNTLKSQPELLKQMLGSKAGGMSDEQLQKSLDAFANLDDQQLERALQMMNKFASVMQPFKSAYDKTNAMVGGNLWKILIVLAIVGFVAFGYMMIGYLVLSSQNASSSGSAQPPIPDLDELLADVDAGSEFEDEF